MLGRISEQAQETLDFIIQYLRETETYPAYRTIAKHCKLSSTNAVVDRLKVLRRRGYIEWTRPCGGERKKYCLTSEARERHNLPSERHKLRKIKAYVHTFGKYEHLDEIDRREIIKTIQKRILQIIDEGS